MFSVATELGWMDCATLLAPHVNFLDNMKTRVLKDVIWLEEPTHDLFKAILNNVSQHPWKDIAWHVRYWRLTLISHMGEVGLNNMSGEKRNDLLQTIRLFSDVCLKHEPHNKEICFQSAFFFGAQYLDMMPDISQKIIFGRLARWMKGDIDGTGNNHYLFDERFLDIYDQIYQRCAEFVLSYTDDQLEVFIERSVYDHFWIIHDRNRLKHDLQLATAAQHTDMRSSPSKM